MLLGNKEKTIILHAENFLQGNLGIEKGQIEAERRTIHNSITDFARDLIKWLDDNQKNPKPEGHTQNTEKMYDVIVRYRASGIITGKISDVHLESRIEELVSDKAQLEDKIKEQQGDILKALNQLKEQDRGMALLESQIFYLKKGKSDGS